MIYISTTQSLSVTLTLKEKSLYDNSYYTFEIIDRASFYQYIFAPDNTSTSIYYDSFTISVGATQSLTASVVLPLYQGEFHYSVYEQQTQYDLNLNNSVKLVEVGILEVLGTSSQIISFTESNDDTIRVFREL